MKLLATVEIPQYIRKVQTSKARRKTYYKKGEKLPKGLQSKLDSKEYSWMFIKDKKDYYLVDDGGDLIIKNKRSAGTPKFKVIKGNDLHALTLTDYDRSKIVQAIKDQMIPEVEKLEPLTEVNYPIRILCEVHHPINDPLTKGQSWDVDNHALFYMKTFPDVLCGCPKIVETEDGSKKLQYLSKRIILDDNVKYITQPPVALFCPVENYEDRKLVFKIYLDTRESIQQYYGTNTSIL